MKNHMFLIQACDCIQPAFPSHHEAPGLYKPSGTVSAPRGPKAWTRALGRPKNKEAGGWAETEWNKEDRVNHREQRTSCHNQLSKPGQIMSEAIFWAAFREAPSLRSQPIKPDHSLQLFPEKRQVQTGPV